MPTRAPSPTAAVCTPKSLPEGKLVKAAETAIAANPANRPDPRRLGKLLISVLTAIGTPGALDIVAKLKSSGEAPEAAEAVATPQHIALLVTKYWGAAGVDLSVSFMETTTAALQNKILGYANKWGTRANVRFRATASGGDVRISRGAGGYWSYLGTDIRHIPRTQQTMNLQGFTLSTSEAEYDRVVCHEFGHTLGAPHEHMRRAIVALIDEQKAIAYFGRTQDWSPQDVRDQVLTPLEEASLAVPGVATPPADQDSIMTYSLPGSIMKNGQPVRGGSRINEADFAYLEKVYPKAIVPPLPPTPPTAANVVDVNADAKVITAPAGWTFRQA